MVKPVAGSVGLAVCYYLTTDVMVGEVVGSSIAAVPQESESRETKTGYEFRCISNRILVLGLRLEKQKEAFAKFFGNSPNKKSMIRLARAHTYRKF